MDTGLEFQCAPVPDFRPVGLPGAMTSVSITGAGLAGLAAAAALADAGFEIDVYEAKPYPGGRATSYSVPQSDGEPETIDNCQHILLRCCVYLLDFYRRLGVSHAIDFHREFYWIERGGRISEFRAGSLPRPAHFTESFLGLKFLNLPEKLALMRAVLALRVEDGRRQDLDRISMLDWLREKRQPELVIERFWRQVLVSAVNEELDRMAAAYGFKVLSLGFLATRDACEMGVPSVPLGELYSAEYWLRWPNVRFHFRHPVTSLESVRADYHVVAAPFERAASLVTGLEVPKMEHSPITGIHLWFDRPVTDLPHATLLDSPLQWMFNKGAGRQIQVVVSASRSLTSMSRKDVLDLAKRELEVFFPAVREAMVLKGHVVKEVRATFSALPGLRRPGPATSLPNVFVAGDWTDTGWPSTMEGAVRSGYAAAEAVAAAAGRPLSFHVPEINTSSDTFAELEG